MLAATEVELDMAPVGVGDGEGAHFLADALEVVQAADGWGVGLVDHGAGLAQAAELDGAPDGFEGDVVAKPLGRETAV